MLVCEAFHGRFIRNAQSICYASAIGRINFVAVVYVAYFNFVFAATHVSGSIFKQPLFFAVIHQLEKFTRLLIVVVVIFVKTPSVDITVNFFHRVCIFRLVFQHAIAVGFIVNGGSWFPSTRICPSRW